MDASKSVNDWLVEKQLSAEHLLRATEMDHRIVQAIIEERYTPSPAQRQRVAAALGVAVEEVAWGHTLPVSHLYGHGPQFGRTP